MTFDENMVSVIMDKVVEESKDVMTDRAYNEGLNFITDVFRSNNEDMNRLKYSYNSGFFQGKYAMRRQMLIMFEDILGSVVNILEGEEDEAN